MEEIKINDYVRTKQGTISKITEIAVGIKDVKDTLYFTEKYEYYHCNDIVKHSKNIIDLIEEGDFINGMQVDEFDDEEGTVLGIPVYEDGLFNTLNFYVPIESINIKTILTKEKFESECFKVEEGQDV